MAVESNIYALWAKKQTAKGSAAAATATKRLIQVAGDFQTNREDGSENFSDLDRFGNQTDFVNTITGEGNPGIEFTCDEGAYLLWLFFGQESVVGSADPYVHTFTPGTNGGFWSTFWARVGQNEIRREKFVDCKAGQLQLEGSTGAKVIRITPTLLSLDPGIIYTVDPVAAMPTEKPLLYTEGTGTFTANGVVLEGQSQFTATWDEGLSPYYGDDVVPVDLIVGNASIGIAITILVDTEGHQEYNKRIYGSATPALDTKPLKALDPIGSYTFTLAQKTSAGVVTPARELTLTIPGVKWSPDLAIPPNPDGGAIELALSGQMRKVPATPASTIVVKNGQPAYT